MSDSFGKSQAADEKAGFCLDDDGTIIRCPYPEQLTQGDNDPNSWNPDELMQCPYDLNHKIRVCRFPYHLIKCGKNHPDLVKKMKTCPFNAKHVLPQNELSHHLAVCPDGQSVTIEDVGITETQCKFQVPVSTWTNPDTQEDWDQEEDGASTPFIWGVSTSQILQTRQVPETNRIISLNPQLRVPHTMPWKWDLEQ
ncbi:gametocyte-specific factor 1-like isoform X2 [Denticeps clupeoides]|uniref:gametocyte-specific factor 1-like isoform X2 n=1 Tax=Denticeps clupeoides TaxID=299321 RepID=UPI0010A2B1EC|nr:gametocyte-specific factor 1-like isoform X2 [Denticeps clupeoides]